MKNLSFCKLLIQTSFLLALALTSAYCQPSLSFVTRFDGTNAAYVESALIQGRDGNLYGTAMLGGNFDRGTVFKLTPSGQLTNLVHFDGTNGFAPEAGLMQDSAGNLCGTTYDGGSNNAGTLFRLTPAGQFSTTSFTAANDSPNAVLLEGANGSYYGTSEFGGSLGRGSVFRWTPAEGVVTLASFNGTNGAYPYDSGLTMGEDGTLYGVAAFGGIGFDSSVYYSGWGTVFKLTTNGTLTAIVSFNGTNGAFPVGVLVRDPDNSLYGATGHGGTGFDGNSYSGFGTVFKVTSAGQLQTLCFFDNLSNGANPFAGLTPGTDGNFYGTTENGGTNYPPNPNNGTVFKMTSEGQLTTLVSFTGTNGSPIGGLLQASNGDFYGTTSVSVGGKGGIFRLNIPGSSSPRLQATKVATQQQFNLNWTALIGRTYQIQYTTNLTQGIWSNLGSQLITTSAVASVSDLPGPGIRQRFYRVALLP